MSALIGRRIRAAVARCDDSMLHMLVHTLVADMDATVECVLPALELAVKQRRFDAASVLLQLKFRNSSSWQHFDYARKLWTNAVESHDLELVTLLLDCREAIGPYSAVNTFCDALVKSPWIAKLLLDAGYDANEYLTLRYAYSIDAMRLLVEYGADVDNCLCDINCLPIPVTALQLAVGERDYIQAQRLLVIGAEPNVADLVVTRWSNESNNHDACDSILDFFSFLLAAGADVSKCSHVPPPDLLEQSTFLIAKCRAALARQRVDLIRERALEVCVALESCNLPALVTCCIIEEACAPFANCVPFHHKWAIVTTVKHYLSENIP